MAVEDEIMKCSFSSLTPDNKSKDTNISKSNWDSCLVETALLSAAITDQTQYLPAKDGNYLKGRMRTAEALKHKYSDDVSGIFDAQSDLIFPTFKVESSREDIFNVWDFPGSVGEGEFVKELNTAVSESYTYLNECTNEDSVNHLTVGVADLVLIPGFGRLDHLTTGIADMSLDQNYAQQLPMPKQP